MKLIKKNFLLVENLYLYFFFLLIDIVLLLHKIYILWSGVHYPLELAHFYGVMPSWLYMFFLAVNTLIYLFIITAGNVFKEKQDDNICETNYKLTLLGIFGVTLLSVVLKKYAIYATAFLYYIAIKSVRFTNDQD